MLNSRSMKILRMLKPLTEDHECNVTGQVSDKENVAPSQNTDEHVKRCEVQNIANYYQQEIEKSHDIIVIPVINSNITTESDLCNNTSLPENVAFNEEIEGDLLLDIPEVTNFLLTDQTQRAGCDETLINLPQGDTNWEKENSSASSDHSVRGYTNDLDYGSIDSNDLDKSNSDSDNNNHRTKRRKRHFVDSNTWNETAQQRKRESGQKYKGKKKVDGKWVYNVKREERKLKERCNCKLSKNTTQLKCSSITDSDRMQIFTTFWSKMSWLERKVYMSFLVKRIAVKRQRNRKDDNISKRSTSLEYYLKLDDEKIRVCKKNVFKYSWCWRKDGFKLNQAKKT
ncbi:hypothetical protein PPYR_01391 [Photinus pyralis]|uniref:Uncharacterized protein n=1 Tax=Photinus pyralis TaxID=7054 RepID=A0A5N4B476_PHOPY|nr:uncharacterized protein LOC116169235 [Photinus pyralis]KAB0804421.1 hypothetical protein PPYR_01391 [Photinus pyralis]